MRDKSQSPRKVSVGTYSLHSEIHDIVFTTNDRLIAGLMGNYLR